MANGPGETFLYFGYGSNLSLDRLQKMNKSATFETVGKVSNFHLSFGLYSPRWGGHVATIGWRLGAEVWGSVYRLLMQDLTTLDMQEGVAENVYEPITVDVHTADGATITCRTYQLVASHEGLPSDTYLDVMLNGARQNKLPQEYIDFLKSIETNGFRGDVDLLEL